MNCIRLGLFQKIFITNETTTTASLLHRRNQFNRFKSDEIVKQPPEPEKQIQIKDIPHEHVEGPRKHVFQEIRESQNEEAIYTIEQAAEYRPTESLRRYWKYSNLATQHTDAEYALRGVENEYTVIHHFPELTDFLMIGAGLIGSATAYYTKRKISRVGDVVVLDKSPYSPNNSTALCNGLISCQSKSQDTSRIATLSKELIRNLQFDVLCTKEDFAKIKYRPCTHLILWPESEVREVLDSVSLQMEDACYTVAKLPHELETTFPWLKAKDSDIALGTHGNQDEALVDPLALRNLYRTLAQAYGANFIVAEVIDFNTLYAINHPEISAFGAAAVVARLPTNGELRNLGFAKTLLCLGHNTPFLEARAEMETYMRDQVYDMHCLEPKLRLCFSFHSFAAPVINFPVITDTDGSVLIREDHAGNFKYYLPYGDCETFLEEDIGRFMNLNSSDEDDETYPNLVHKNEIFEKYFDNVIKAKLVKRIPLMADAKFDVAYSGFESYNSHDGSPIISPHPFHNKVLLSAGYGSRMMTYAPTAAATFTELMLADEEETFDVTPFYWNRVIKGRKIPEFKSLVQ